MKGAKKIMDIDVSQGGRGNSPDQKVKVINSAAVNDELKASTTAVVTFFMQPHCAQTVEDIYQGVEKYMADTKRCKTSAPNCGHLTADFRKVFWCTVMSEWKIINFYFNTDWMDAAKHANNRELLEPYLGKDYRCDGATVARIWSEQQSVLAGCIKLCDVSLEDGIKKYDDNMTKIAKLIASQLH